MARRPMRRWVVCLGAATAIGWGIVAGGGDTSTRPRETIVSAPTRLSRPAIPREVTHAQDRIEESLPDPAKVAPVLQVLPWRGDGIVVSIADAASDGRLVLLVTHAESRLRAQRAYRAFLLLHEDRPGRYVVRYRKMAP